MQTMDFEERNDIYTVSELNNEVRFLLEDTFPLIWVEGEISNFVAPQSGHWYFSLKDASAQVKCAMFRMSQRKVGFTPKDGMHVLIKTRVSLYPATGAFQLIAEDMEERGEGKLRRAFDALKKKLEAAGLFDQAHKKTLPLFPRQIGVITSATGAAIRDILTVLKRRYACANVIIYPTLVQGETAAPAIVKAIQIANRRQECQVLIVARGGGSLEDLWPFNEEIVAQAIYQSDIPIISGVGHEIDFTIADFVADKRAPTPSAAAEMITPDCQELAEVLKHNQFLLIRQMQHKLHAQKQQLTWVQKHLSQQHPKRKLTEKMQRLDFCEATLAQLEVSLLNKLQNKLNFLFATLKRHTPAHKIQALHQQLHLYQHQLSNHMLRGLHKQETALANLAAKLDALSPLATLKRGYAIATKEGQVLQNVDTTRLGEKVHVRLFKGSLDCVVEKINQK